MKILFFINVIPPDYGGGFLRVFRIAARFKEYGWFHKIATFTQKERYVLGTQNIQLEDVLFLQNKFFSSFIILPCYMLFHTGEFDIFYVASTQWFSVIPSLVAKLLHKKVVLGVTLSMVDSPAVSSNGILKRFYYKFKNLQFGWADYIFVNSPLLVAECVNCGNDFKRVKLINNPVDTEKFFPVSYNEKQKLRIANGLSPNTFTILFVGSINKRKGCDLLPLVFRELFSKTSLNITFIMCGQMGYPETNLIINDLKRVFKEYDNSFVVEKEVSNTSPYYQMADLFLFPTTNEGMPNVILEAMASGCMILSNVLPGITDYVLSKDFLVENNDVQGYAHRILDYMNNQQKYTNKIQENIERIKQDYSIDAVDNSIKMLLSE